MLTVEKILKLKEASVVSVREEVTVREAVDVMNDARVGCVVVDDENGNVAGIFTERDLVCRVVGAGLDPATTPITDVMSSPVAGCNPDDDILSCAEMLDVFQVRHLPVLDGQKVIGLVSVRDILAIAFKE